MNVKIIKCFIASSCNTIEERNACEEVFSAINSEFGDQYRFRIELEKWEKESVPDNDKNSQEINNSQLNACELDLFICIFKHKYGTPATLYFTESEAKIVQTVKHHEKRYTSEIQFYLSTEPFPQTAALEEVHRIESFKKKIGQDGFLYQEYSDIEDFSEKLRMNAIRKILEIHQKDMTYTTSNITSTNVIMGARENNLNEILSSKLKCVDLFAGCGGMSLGFLQAGYSIVGAFDNWKPAINCYRNNFITHKIYDMNLKDFDRATRIISRLNPDIIVGGPPCQDFSEAGHRVEGERANLTISYAKIVAAIRPRFFVMENVPRAQKSSAYATAKSIFKSVNYGLTEKVLDASLCGAPQQRKRFFCIGALNCNDDFLLDTLNSRLAEIPLSVKDYLQDEIDFDFYYKHPRTYGRRAIFSVFEPASTIRGCNRPLPQNYKKHKNDATDPINVRALTTKELARIQTFPADFKWPQSNSISTQLIGNAVPVALANFIAVAILDYSLGRTKAKQISFVDWLVETRKISTNAACDVLSRFRRIIRLTNKRLWDASEIEVSFHMKPLIDLPRSTQTQLKRACVLHCEYMKSIKDGAL